MRRPACLAFVVLCSLAARAGAGDLSSVDVSGDLPKAGSLHVADLEALGPVTATYEEHGRKHEVTGVPVEKVLAAFGFTPGSEEKGVPIDQKLAGWRKAVLAVGHDGYQVAFSCAELSPEVGATRALLVWKTDGATLRDPMGPFKLVVLSDRGPARWVRQLASLVVIEVRRPAER